MGDRYRPTTTTRAPAGESIRVATDGAGQGNKTIRDFEDRTPDGTDWVPEGGPLDTGKKANSPFEAMEDSYDVSDVETFTGEQRDIERLQDVAGKERFGVLDREEVSISKIEAGAVDLEPGDQEAVLNDLEELASRNPGLVDSHMKLAESIQKSNMGESVELSAGETEILANVSAQGNTSVDIPGYNQVDRSAGKDALMEAYDASGEVAVVENGNHEVYAFQDEVREMDPGEFPEGVDKDAFLEKIDQINEREVSTVMSDGGPAAKVQTEQKEVSQVRIFGPDDQEKLDNYVNGQDAPDPGANTGDSPYSIPPNQERTMSSEELEFVAEKSVVGREVKSMQKKKATDEIAKKIGYKNTGANSLHGKMEMAEQGLRVGVVDDDGQFNLSNGLNESQTVEMDTPSGVVQTEVKNPRVLALKTDANDIVTDAKVMKSGSIQEDDMAPKYQWTPDQSVSESAAEKQSDGSFGTLGNDTVFESGKAGSPAEGVQPVSGKDGVDAAPQAGNVMGMDEVAERVGKAMDVDGDGTVMFRGGNKNEFGDVFEDRVNEAVHGERIKSDASEDYEFPDVPSQVIEAKVVDTNTSVGVGAKSPGSQEPVASEAEGGKVQFRDAEGEFEFTPEETRYVVAFNDTDSVSRSNISQSHVDEILDRRPDVSTDDVYKGDPSPGKINSASEDEWRGMLREDFVADVGRVTSGVVASGETIGSNDKGAVTKSPTKRYTIDEFADES